MKFPVKRMASVLTALMMIPPAVRAGEQTVDQKDKTFIPHILAIRTGATVDFPNFDPIFHNAFSNYDGKIFDVGLYPPGSSRSVNFSRPGVVRVFCNIHAAMSALIVVLNTPYFTTSRKDGMFELPAVPAGEYWLRIFHERSCCAPYRSRIQRAQMRRAARNLAISSKKSMCASKKKESRDAKSSMRIPRSRQAST